MSPEGPPESLPPTQDSRRTSLTDFGYKKGMNQDTAKGRLQVDLDDTKDPIKPDQSTTVLPQSNAAVFRPKEAKPYDWKDEEVESTNPPTNDKDALQDSA